MATSDYFIDDQTGASFLLDINGQLAAIQTNNSKDTAPVAADGVAVGMLWYNSATTAQRDIPAGTVGVCTACYRRCRYVDSSANDSRRFTCI